MDDTDTIDSSHLLRIVIDGPGVQPDAVNADEWFELVKHYQKAIAAAAELESGEKPTGTYFAITEITSKCIQLISSTSPSGFLGAKRIGAALQNQDREALTDAIWSDLDAVARHADKRNWNFSVWAPANREDEQIVELHDPKQLPPEPRIYREEGDWVSVGRCLRVNLERPDATLLLSNEARTRIPLTGSKSQLKKLARHLDQLIEIRGRATWLKPSWQIESFELDSFRLMEDDSVDLFAKIPEATRREFEDVDPFEIREFLRGGKHE